MELTFAPEAMLDNKRIEDWFDLDFFNTNFWMIFTTMFAFQRWSSVAEMRRYMKRFMHLMPGLKYIGGILRTKYNQYHSVVLPLKRYLEDKGVHFALDHQVVDIDFEITPASKRATTLHVKTKEGMQTIMLGEDDYCFMTNGSITESTDTGDLNTAPKLKGMEPGSFGKRSPKKIPLLEIRAFFATISTCKSGTPLPSHSKTVLFMTTWRISQEILTAQADLSPSPTPTGSCLLSSPDNPTFQISPKMSKYSGDMSSIPIASEIMSEKR